MVTIKRPTKKPLSAGCNTMIILFAAQLVATVLFFTLSSVKNPSTVPQALPGLKDHLGQSIRSHSKSIASSSDLHQRQDSDHGVPKLKDNVEDEPLDQSPVRPNNVEKLSESQAGGNYYFADFAYDREYPLFRFSSVADWSESHDTAVGQLGQSNIRSCQYKSDEHSVLFHNQCLKENTKLIAYNSAHFQRHWCGITIPPGEAVEIPKYCNEPVTLFPIPYIPTNGHGMPPVEVTSSPNATSTTPMMDVACDIPCQVEVNMEGIERFVRGVDWKIIQVINDPTILVERTSFRHDIYYSTLSFKSSVPLSYFSFEKYNIFAPPVDFDTVDASGSYLVNDHCVARNTKRNRWAEAVAERYSMKNYGRCAHNTDLPSGKSLDSQQDRMELLRKHRFNLALEVDDAKDYLTPAIWEAISSGTLPVILGAQNVKDHLPPDSFLPVAGLQKYADLGTLVAAVAANKTAWQSYHTWRSNADYRQQFDSKYNFTRTSPDCRMCRWAYAKMYGLGWSHKEQMVRETFIDRKLCLDDSSKLVSKPFKESWHMLTNQTYTDIVKSNSQSTCTESSTTSSIPQVTKLTRSVSSHDNVIDIVLHDFVNEPPEEDIILRLEFPVANSEGSHFPFPHTLVPTLRGPLVSSLAIQDAKSKVMILTSWPAEIASTTEGIVEVTIRKHDEDLLIVEDERRRIRVIIEDMCELNDKATEYFPSSFAKLQVNDFIDPLDLFYVET